MGNTQIFSATLGLSPPWQITSIDFPTTDCMNITVDFTNGAIFSCPVCGQEAPVCKTEHERWHHHDFFMFSAYLRARVPRVECFTCGVNSVERPWAKGSEFRLIP